MDDEKGYDATHYDGLEGNSDPANLGSFSEGEKKAGAAIKQVVYSTVQTIGEGVQKVLLPILIIPEVMDNPLKGGTVNPGLSVNGSLPTTDIEKSKLL